MTEDLHYILEEIKNEIKAYNELGAMLAQSAHDISAAAAPPSEDLLADMAAARAGFSSLKKKLSGMEGITPDSLESLKAMEDFVNQRLREENQAEQLFRLQERISLLDKIINLRNILPVHYRALEDCKNQARQLKEQLLELDEDSALDNPEELEIAITPFQALATLVERSDQLDDETWLDLNSVVEKTFSTPLALAASRKRLLPGDLPPDSPASQPAAQLPIASEPALADNGVSEPAASTDTQTRAKKRWLPLLLVTAVIAAAVAFYAYLTQFTFQPDGFRLKTYGVIIKDINHPLQNGDTYLTRAAGEKNLLEMQLLLKHGARINDPDQAGDTPLHLAVQADFQNGVELLLQKGADLTIRNSQGKTPGELAVSLGYADIASLLRPGGTPRQNRDLSTARNPFAMQR